MWCGDKDTARTVLSMAVSIGAAKDSEVVTACSHLPPIKVGERVRVSRGGNKFAIGLVESLHDNAASVLGLDGPSTEEDVTLDRLVHVDAMILTSHQIHEAKVLANSRFAGAKVMGAKRIVSGGLEPERAGAMAKFLRNDTVVEVVGARTRTYTCVCACACVRLCGCVCVRCTCMCLYVPSLPTHPQTHTRHTRHTRTHRPRQVW